MVYQVSRPTGIVESVVKPAPFTYHAPTTPGEAVSLLAEYGDDAKVIAGGQSLVPILAMRLARFDHLIDLIVCAREIAVIHADRQRQTKQRSPIARLSP